MGRGRESAGKRQIKARQNDRKAAKAGRRQERLQNAATAAVDEAEVMARFHELNEQRAAGVVDDAEYTARRHEILVALGLDHHLMDTDPSDAPDGTGGGSGSGADRQPPS